jgi:hypothetical protein
MEAHEKYTATDTVLMAERLMGVFRALKRWCFDGKLEGELTETDFDGRWPNTADNYIAQLYGYEDSTAMLREWNDELVGKMALLAGPHGWSVYKMMLAKRDET